jgi:hypothetical protein
MTLALSATDWHHLWQESRQNTQTYNSANPFDLIVEYPQHLAKGYKRHIELRNGITLNLKNARSRVLLNLLAIAIQKPLASPFAVILRLAPKPINCNIGRLH